MEGVRNESVVERTMNEVDKNGRIVSLKRKHEESVEITSNEYSVHDLPGPDYIPNNRTVATLERIRHQQYQKITLNVGGKRFDTSISTLYVEPSSILAKIAQCIPVQREYFIDRNPRHFDVILDFLRNPIFSSNILPTDRVDLRQIYDEASYYGLPDLLRLVEEKATTLGFLDF